MMKLFQKTKTQEDIDKDIEEERVKIKLAKIKAAKQDERHRKPNPQQGKLFHEELWLDFTVIQDKKNIRLHTYRCEPLGTPKGIVILFHGLCAHVNHGGHIAHALHDAGFAVVGFDHRGFGKSEGLRGFLEDLDMHLEDSNQFVDQVIKHYSQRYQEKLPLFMMGLSMGGMTSFRLAIQKPWQVRGIIMFAPAIKPLQGKATIQLSKALGAVLPKYKLFKMKKGTTTKNPQISEELGADPHTYTEEMRPGTAKTILTAMDQAQNMFHMLNVPWLLFQGGLDKLVDPDLARELEQKSPSKDKTVVFYDDCWHDIWHEQEILDAIPKVVQWVSSRV